VSINVPIVHPPGVYKYGEPWWNDINREKLLILPPDLSDNPTSSHLVAKQGDLANEMMNFALRSISFLLLRVLEHATKFYDMRPKALLPLQQKVYCRFLSPLAESWVHLGSNSKHANH
jgi:hypothetical protein